MKPEQRSYECIGCGAKIILYGGKTSNTNVVCSCGKWMRIYDDEDATELMNAGIERDAGEVAINSSNPIGEKKP